MPKTLDPETGEVLSLAPTEEGVWLVGPLLGVKQPAPYDIDGRQGVSKRKIGISIYGQEYSVVAGDLAEFEEAIAGARKGDIVAVRAYPLQGRFGLRWSLSPSAGGGWD